MKKIIPFIFSYIFTAGVVKAQIPNADMESWISNFGVEDPEDWTTFNFYSFFAGASTTVNKTTDSQTGNWAATVESIEFTDSSGITQIFQGFMLTGFPINTRYANFSFWYKYNNGGGDSAIVAAVLTKWNTATQHSDSLGWAIAYITSNINTYSLANIPFQYFTTETPDSAFIIVVSNVTNDFIPGSKLWVDNFSLSGIASISELSAANVSIYPNPASIELMLEMAIPIKGMIEIYDANGKMVRVCAINGTNTSISVADLPRNTYLYIIKDHSGKSVSAGKVLLGQ